MMKKSEQKAQKYPHTYFFASRAGAPEALQKMND